MGKCSPLQGYFFFCLGVDDASLIVTWACYEKILAFKGAPPAIHTHGGSLLTCIVAYIYNMNYNLMEYMLAYYGLPSFKLWQG